MMRVSAGACLIVLLSMLPSQAADVYFCLVDARRTVPLEFWQKDEPLANGTMYHRLPTGVFIDDASPNYAAYGADKGNIDGGNDSDFEREMVPEPKIDSDRKGDVVGNIGVKALVKAEVKDGAHTFHPGGLRFTATDADGIASTEPALERKTRLCFYVRCYPVDFNLLRNSEGPGKTDVSVTSGGKLVYEDTLDSRTPAVLRLYLPPGAYAFAASGMGTLSLTVSPTGVKSDKASDGLAVFTRDFTVALRRGNPLVVGRPEPANAPSELYAFIDRNREVFAEGERVGISIRAWGAAAKAATATLTLNDALPTAVPLKPAGDGAAAEVELDTALLRPGRYTVLLKAGDTVSNPLPLTVAPLLGLTNMKIFSHLKWGDSTMDPGKLNQLADLGFTWLSNTEHPNAYFVEPHSSLFDSWNGVPTSPSRVKALPPGPHLPPELTQVRMPVGTGMETMLARGVQYLTIHLGLIHYFNVGEHWRDQADDRYQVLRHASMLLRRYPNFAGFTYCTGDGPTPATMGSVFGSAGVASFDVIHDQRLKKLHEVFELKYGKIGVDLSNPEKVNTLTEKDIAERELHGLAWGFHVGEDITLPVTGDAEKTILWNQWVNDLYPDSFRTVRAGLEQTIRNPLLTCGGSWGLGAGGGMYPGTFYRALDFALNDEHGDYGNCNFNEITCSDILAMGMEDAPARPWVGLDLIRARGKQVGFKHLLHALSRTPSGVGVLNVSQGDWVCGWANDKVQSEDLAALTDLAARFGDVFSTLDRVDDIAVVSSFRQEVLGGQPFRALYAAHYLTQKAGYQANIITDAYVAKHADMLARRFRALFFFRMTKPLSPGMKAALETYRKAGGKIIIDAATTVEFPEAIKLPFAVPHSHGPSNTNDHLEFEAFFLPLVQQFRAAVGPAITPVFAFTSHRKTLHHEINWNAFRARSGDLEYWIVANDGKPKMEDGVGAQMQYEGDVADVRSTLPGVLYDALRRAPVTTTPAAGGVGFTCDGMHYPGTIYLVAPRPVQALSVSASPTVAQGQAAVLRAAALDAVGTAFTGVLPVEFTVTDPTGVERYHLFRTTNRALSLKIAANDPAGTWTWRAADQATGLTATGTFTVTAADARPRVTTLDDVVCDADAVHAFLKRPVTIALDHTETALLPQAQTLAEGLKARGVKAEVRVLWPSEQRQYPMQWFYKSVEDLELRDNLFAGEIVGRRIRGKNHLGDHRNDNFGTYAFYKQYVGSAPYLYYRDVILLGRDDVAPGPLLSTILRGRMMLRNPSSSFPARDAGTIGYAWGPFEARYDAVVCYGTGRAGLERAVAALLAQAERTTPPARAFTPALPRTTPENGEAFREMAILPAQGALVATTANTREAVSLLPLVYGTAIAETRVVGNRLFVLRNDLPAPTAPAATRCVVADTRNWKATAYTLPAELQPAGTAAMAWSLDNGGKRWPASHGLAIGTDYLATAGFGVGRYRQDGTPVWFYDPYPVFNTYEEAKYPRRARNIALSPDGSLAMAAFYSKTPNQEFKPWRHNRCDVVVLDTATGKPLATLARYHGDSMRIATDNSRLTVLDIFYDIPGEEHNHRAIPNPHNGPGLAVFSRDGQEQHFFPLSRDVAVLSADTNLTLATITFTDARRRVTVCDLLTGAKADFRYPRIDVGVATAPDGAFAVVTFSDGAVVRLDRAAKQVWKTTLPVRGKPSVLADNRIVVTAPDNTMTLLDADGKVLGTHSLAAANPAPWTAVVDPLPATLEPPAPTPWWDAPPEGVTVTKLNTNISNGSAKINNATDYFTLPALEKTKTVLAAFTYTLTDPTDRLTVTLEGGGVKVSYPLPAHNTPWPAAVPIRLPDGGRVSINFAATKASHVANLRLLVVDASAWNNAAVTREDMPSKSAPLPRLMVPAVFGLSGDPRAEQMSSGLMNTNIYKVFDGQVYAGMNLFEVKYPQNAPWDGGAEPDLRSARIVMEFRESRTILGLGIWNTPGDLPIEGWALECCNQYKVDDQMTKELLAPWKLVASGRNLTEIYSLAGFKPTKARVWRLTLTRTPAKMQSLAEVELFEDVRDSIGDDDPDAGDLDL
jgi:hypothetical protein